MSIMPLMHTQKEVRGKWYHKLEICTFLEVQIKTLKDIYHQGKVYLTLNDLKWKVQMNRHQTMILKYPLGAPDHHKMYIEDGRKLQLRLLRRGF